MSLNERATILLNFDSPFSTNESNPRKWLNEASCKDNKISRESGES